MSKNSKCCCGAELPDHLILFGDDARFVHVCSCERRYVVRDGKFVHQGQQVNPFSRYDAANAREGDD